jgi:DNA repair protein RecO (recombination protein O)
VFAGYVQALGSLNDEERRPAALRSFEKRLLEHLGFGLMLEHEAHGQAPVDPDALYRYLPEAGPARLGADAVADTPGVYRGAMLLALARDELASQDALAAARDLYRQALDLYLGDRPLRVRAVARALRRPASGAGHDGRQS